MDLSRLGNRILVVAPHPDDEIIGAGGTLMKAKALGADVHVVYLTNGWLSAGFLPDTSLELRRQIRLEESSVVCATLGFNRHVIGLDSHEDGLCERDRVLVELTRLVRELKPSSILIPSADDSHREHKDTHELSVKAAHQSGWSGLCLAYEIWGFVRADVYSLVSEWFDVKARSLEQYVTAMRAYNYVAHCFCLGLFRASRAAERHKLAEAFQTLNLD